MIRWEYYKNGQSQALNPSVRLLSRNSSLELVQIAAGDDGTYRCIASNTEGSDQKDFNIEVNSEPTFSKRPNQIIVSPNGKKKEMKLNCRAQGKPTPSIDWFKNGVLQKSWNGKNQITVPTLKKEDTALYQCKIKNKYSQSIASAEVMVLGKSLVDLFFLSAVYQG